MSNPNRAEPLDGNPFDDTSDVNPFGAHANASSFSLEDQTTPNASKYSFGGNPAAESTTYSAREEELRRKDEEIRRREQELNMRERNLDRTEAKANWPPCECAEHKFNDNFALTLLDSSHQSFP
ncbi:hypothetical protein QFC24_000533 [Naganishia onofrii]|uniref:Uncharacterized protein n=1 Tax=Naganishia onofrii TaxID=1851511 RepID=A0ACC2XX22_9TREE|nr:hypothetical protein QFC24_000533 [Naganishia onofrii]